MTLYISRAIRIALFILLLAITDQVVGFVLRKLYFHQHTGPMHALNYALNDCDADILIFGASQAQHGYDPVMISDSLKMSCYNAGLDGGHSIILQYAEIKEITKRYTPKILILDFHPENIVHYAGDYDRLNVLLPYYKNYPDLRPFILLRSPYERVKLISAIYPFNSMVIDAIRYNTFTHAARIKDIKGYIPLNGVMNLDMYKSEPEAKQSVVDTNMVKSLRNTIILCKEKNISLFIVSSPVYRTFKDRQKTRSLAAKLSLEILEKEKVNYFDFSFDTTITERIDWFEDQNHLNDTGTKIFTQKLIDVIKTIRK
jgi:hypothetical protein